MVKGRKEAIQKYLNYWFDESWNFQITPRSNSSTSKIAFLSLVCTTYDSGFSSKITECDLVGMAQLSSSWSVARVAFGKSTVQMKVHMRFNLKGGYRDLAQKEFTTRPEVSSISYQVVAKSDTLEKVGDDYRLHVTKYISFTAVQRKVLGKVLKAIHWDYQLKAEVYSKDGKKLAEFQEVEEAAILMLQYMEPAGPGKEDPFAPLECKIECEFTPEAIAKHPMINARNVKRLMVAPNALEFAKKLKAANLVMVLTEYCSMFVDVLNTYGSQAILLLPDNDTFTFEVRTALQHRSPEELHHLLLAHTIILSGSETFIGQHQTLDETSITISSNADDIIADVVHHHNRSARVLSHWVTANGNQVLVLSDQLYYYRIFHVQDPQNYFTPIAYMTALPQYSHFVELLAITGIMTELRNCGTKLITILAPTNDTLTRVTMDGLVDFLGFGEEMGVQQLERLNQLRNLVLHHIVSGVFNPENGELETPVNGVSKISGSVQSWANQPLTFSIRPPYSSMYFDRERLGESSRWIRTAGLLRGNLITISNMLIERSEPREF